MAGDGINGVVTSERQHQVRFNAKAKESQAMKVTDPVCGMSIEAEMAHANETYQGRTYYLCWQSASAGSGRTREKYASKAGEPGTHDGGHHGHG